MEGVEQFMFPDSARHSTRGYDDSEVGTQAHGGNFIF
jgi:hypothetical protein